MRRDEQAGKEIEGSEPGRIARVDGGPKRTLESLQEIEAMRGAGPITAGMHSSDHGQFDEELGLWQRGGLPAVRRSVERVSVP